MRCAEVQCQLHRAWARPRQQQKRNRCPTSSYDSRAFEGAELTQALSIDLMRLLTL